MLDALLLTAALLSGPSEQYPPKPTHSHSATPTTSPTPSETPSESPSATPSASPSPTRSESPTATPSTSPSAVPPRAEILAATGPRERSALLGGIALALLSLGVFALLVRRRGGRIEPVPREALYALASVLGIVGTLALATFWVVSAT